MNKHVKVLGEMFQQCANERRMKEADALSAAIAALGQGEAVGDAYWHHDGDGTSEMRVNWYGTPPASGTPLYTHTPPSLPAGWVLVPERMHVPADAWESAAFSFGGPAAGEGEAYLDCTLWVGNIENDDGTKTYGLHVSCDECPEEGSITLAEFAVAQSPEAQPQGEKCCGYANPITGNCYTCGKPALECLQASLKYAAAVKAHAPQPVVPEEEDECPHCVNGITPMTMDRPCRHCTPTLHTHTQEGRG